MCFVRIDYFIVLRLSDSIPTNNCVAIYGRTVTEFLVDGACIYIYIYIGPWEGYIYVTEDPYLKILVKRISKNVGWIFGSGSS